MHGSGYVLKRFRERDAQPFPVLPVLPMDQPYIGFVCFLSAEAIFESLRPFRQEVTGIWSGEIPDLGLITAVFFNSPQMLGDRLSTILPLQNIRDGQFASFAMEYSGKHESSASHISSLDLYWRGEFYTAQIRDMTPVSLAALWPAPEIIVHRGKMFAVTEFAFEAQSGETEKLGTSRKTTKVTKVNAAKPIKDGIQDVFSATDKALNDLEEQTKLSNIFKRLFRQRSVGHGYGKTGTAKGDGHKESQISKGPGLAESLAGWVRWHTPLGNGLRKQMGERLGLVEKLINRGDIDSALKLALKLGNSKSLKK